jgi:hypothetical protein
LRHPISEVPHGLSRHYLAEPFCPKVLLTYAFSYSHYLVVIRTQFFSWSVT